MNYFKNFPFHSPTFLNLIIEFFICNIIGFFLLFIYYWLILIPSIYLWFRLFHYVYKKLLSIFKYFVNKILIEHKLIEPPKKIITTPRITRRLPNQKR